ncbi:S1 domain-containing protein [Thermotalea metallivorans]|uniref:Uncharacterized protein n=1 Tax=Thermotalea metallivorans TaxID=520762 RepID=A0A140L6P4_9FIRM|nr:S1 RNA-binding domain-containing protein [Thermotalea metallivorans]KXG76219.1 hypothetical protein AN619_11760 [Thermotalea metallivorans]
MKKAAAFLCLILLMSSITSYGDSQGPYRNGFIEGYVKKVLEKEIQIEEYDGTIHQLPFDPNALLTIDGVPASLKDFKAGMEVYGELKGRRLYTLESYATENLGYIPPGGKIRTGIVKKIDRDQIVLQLPTGQKETYFASAATIAMKKGAQVPHSVLYEGDRVKLYFDEIDSSLISKMEIEGDSIVVKDLYRGKLAFAHDLENKMVLEEVEALRNGKWEAVKPSIAIPYAMDLPLYAGGQKISYKQLKNYQGRTVYMAVKDFFGSQRAEKMIVKGQYESTYADKIKDINWYTQGLELNNNKNLAFHEGTIVIKNGRLVDMYSIDAKADVFVVADGRGSNLLADVIYVYNEDINHSNIGRHVVYSGRLDVILQDQVTLKNFFVLDNNQWVSFGGQKDLYYDSDTSIFDMEAQKFVSPKEFYAKDYAVDENSDYAKNRNLKDWHGYIYTDGDQIRTILVQKNMDSLLNQRITNGVIDKVYDDPLVGWTLELRDGKDWSSSKKQWMEKNASLRINLEKAMIIKDERMISAHELKAGDRLYMVRNDFEGKIIIVK